MEDIFNNIAAELKEKKLFLFDMDGTIYEEECLFDGTLELIKYIEESGGRYIFITNNSSKSVVDYIYKINRLGIKADKENFFTSVQATILMLKEKYPKIKIYCQGTKSLITELRESGLIVTEEVEPDVDLVLVGFDTELTSKKIRNTCELLMRDIPFYATNPDLTCPVSFGFIPDCGSICMILKNATRREPIYIGKPEPTMVYEVMKKFSYTKKDTTIIGDRLYTDISAGINAGVTSICVLTGEAKIEDILNGDIKPTYTFASVKDLADKLKC